MSSTFRDMHAEREILRRDVFPVIRQACEQRGASFFEIDLRWGVTREEAEGGRVLPVCLTEIDRCRPFVLGLIGARYGWADPNALHVLGDPRFETLRPYAMQSVTELELRYAILNRPANAPAAVGLVYRRPHAPVTDEDRGGAHRIGALIEALKDSGLPVRDTPEDLAAFARGVRDDLFNVIKAHLPGCPASDTDRARLRTHATATALGHRYVDRPLSSDLVRLIRRRERRIAILGPVGSGKSMLAAHLTRLIQEGSCPGTEVVAALGSAGWAGSSQAFEAILQQLRAAPERGDAATPANARTSFHAVLHASAERSHIVAIIDGVDEPNLSPDLLPAWCPDAIKGATIVVTLRNQALFGRLLRRCRWQVVELGPITPSEATALSNQYFAPYGRRLGDRQLSALTQKPRSSFELSLMLEELRYVPHFEDLDERILELAKLPSLAAILDLALHRIDVEYGAARMILDALALAPDGLPEPVLQLIGGEPGSPLAPLTFALVRGALEGVAAVGTDRLVLRSSLVRERILQRISGDIEVLRATIADRLRLNLSTPGAAEELLRHLLAMQRWREAADMLANGEVFDAMVRRAPQQLRAGWSRIREHDSAAWPGAYSAWVAQELPRRAADAAALAEDLGDVALAEQLAQDVRARARGSDPAAFAIAASVLAGLAEARGHFGEALSHLQEIETNRIDSSVPHAQAAAAIRRARIMLVQGGPAAAAGPLDRARMAAAQTGDDRLHAIVLAMQGAIAFADRNLAVAKQTFDDLRALGDRLGDLPILSEALANLAKVEREEGNLRRAEELASSGLRFAEISGDDRVRQNALGIAARVAMERGNLDRASELVRSRLSLTRAIHDVIGELEASIDYASLCTRIGDPKEGERIEAETYARAHAVGLLAFAIRHPSW